MSEANPPIVHALDPDRPDRHFVCPEPFDPAAEEVLPPARQREMMAGYWRLVWWKLRRHKLAVGSGVVLILLYLVVAFAEVLAPYPLGSRDTDHIYAPPQSVHLFHDGAFIGPYVYPLDYTLDMVRLKREYAPDTTRPQPLRFFCAGLPYRFWGLFEANVHLVCPPEGGTLFLLGTDRLGQDMASRLMHGTRVSMTVGLIGIAISFVIGVTLGGMAGYFGGWVDAVVQRMIEILRSLPELPLWMALSAAVPVTWSPIVVFFCITLILGLIDWPGLARAVRSKLLALREEDYVTAAQLIGARPARIIGRHLLPNFSSHLIASVTLSIPGMILGETALSFLGLGLRPPVTSWGVMLTEAQNIEAVVLYPWLMTPMLAVMVAVLAFNFLGDGLRDAADPYD
ncbi:ABC transporter permease [Roseospira marina]|uniref:ABC transporter permease n=1 Tax=Roseospira marina TaxID=140057 RepID=A0A5M6IBR9_9PROT|nr:ABC transporter permease [Roseospira marina]KAA5605734.1 ABC transporter permease [Roseospira marina]MBB4313535.1 peptide/nickel transport system permease protein [Roseospira marina]MBB5086697.1 peptide/nickel transport system permease protein [Roseospira marina]